MIWNYKNYDKNLGYADSKIKNSLYETKFPFFFFVCTHEHHYWWVKLCSGSGDTGQRWTRFCYTRLYTTLYYTIIYTNIHRIEYTHPIIIRGGELWRGAYRSHDKPCIQTHLTFTFRRETNHFAAWLYWLHPYALYTMVSAIFDIMYFIRHARSILTCTFMITLIPNKFYMRWMSE